MKQRQGRGLFGRKYRQTADFGFPAVQTTASFNPSTCLQLHSVHSTFLKANPVGSQFCEIF